MKMTPVKMKRNLVVVAVVGLALSGLALADQFHYNNLLLGDRAMGLGGAYGGVSDDASGIYYNPAGLAFALSNDISGSVNLPISKKRVVYKKTVGSADFIEKSEGSFAPFAGFIQKLDQYVDGLVGGFALYTTDSNLKDQDDLIQNNTELRIERYHRTVNERSSTSYFPSLAAGYRISSNASIGFAISGFSVSELVQEFQEARQTVYDTSTSPATPRYQVLHQNIRQNLTAYGIEPTIGAQMAFGGKYSVGLTVKQGFLLSESCDQNVEVLKIWRDDATGEYAIRQQAVLQNKYKHPLGGWPMQARLGLAWFASTRLLSTADVSYHGPATKSDNNLFKKVATWNAALGSEYYVTPAFPLRVGFFTNNDNRPQVESGKAAQPDHIDYYGMSLFVGWTQPNSQIAVGGMVQQGKGKAQKLGTSAIQDVEAIAYNLGFTVAHLL